MESYIQGVKAVEIVLSVISVLSTREKEFVNSLKQVSQESKGGSILRAQLTINCRNLNANRHTRLTRLKST